MSDRGILTALGDRSNVHERQRGLGFEELEAVVRR
jgi:hypothetical protein